MSNDVSATDLSVASDLPEVDVQIDAQASSEAPAESASAPVPVEVVVVGSAEESQSVDSDVATKPAVEVAVAEASVEVSAEVASEKTESKPTAKSTNNAAKKVEPVAASADESKKDEQPEPAAAANTAANPFQKMGLSSQVLEAIGKAGYTSPSPIQAQTVPYILSGRDMMGQAETGSGKTAAFAWPILSKLDMKQKKPQVLVLAPTRELAIQVTRAFEKYASGISGFRAVTIYGGQSYETQNRALSRGVQVVVGTPGRVMDHLRRGTLDLTQLKTFILDEADEMLRMGFIEDVEWILEQVPGERQILTFSATLPPPIQRIAQKYLDDPAHVVIKGSSATADSIKQTCIHLSGREKLARLARILETEETDGVIVFVKTRNSTQVVSEHLIQRGVIASALNGDIAQNQRERTVSQLKSGRINVVVATDVAARGLDVERISHVINYDFPHDTEAYVHRIGRTGRAGRTGNAILFVEPKEKGKLTRLQRATNQHIGLFKQKSIEEINDLRIEKFKQAIVEASTDKQIGFFTNLLAELQNDSEMTPELIAAGLAVMARGDNPLLLKDLPSHSKWKKERNSKNDRRRGGMQTYRIEVGRSHKIGPGNIVGAITNEADIDNSMIGRINLFEDFSTIDLPSDIPNGIIEHLSGVYVGGQKLNIAKDDRKYEKDSGRGGRGARGYGGRNSRGGGGGRYGKKSGGSYGKKSYEKKPYEKKSYSKPAETSPSGEKKSYGEKKSFGDKKQFGDKKPAADKRFGSDRKPRNKSNAHGKPQGYSKFENSEFKAERYTKKSSGGTKTKAAQRTKAKRKPGAKLSGPVKKYVKIRSAK